MIGKVTVIHHKLTKMRRFKKKRKLLMLNLLLKFNNRRAKLKQISTYFTDLPLLVTVSSYSLVEKCKYLINWRLGHRQYRHLYKQYYRPAWIKPTLNQIAGGDWSMANQIAKRSFETQIVKRENQMANFKRKSDTRHLRMKVHQNMLQYYFRVQNPKWLYVEVLNMLFK